MDAMRGMHVVHLLASNELEEGYAMANTSLYVTLFLFHHPLFLCNSFFSIFIPSSTHTQLPFYLLLRHVSAVTAASLTLTFQ